MVHDMEGGKAAQPEESFSPWGEEGNEGNEGGRELQTHLYGAVARGREVLSRSTGLP